MRTKLRRHLDEFYTSKYESQSGRCVLTVSSGLLFALFFQSPLRVWGFKSVSCVPPLRFSGMLTGIKRRRTATGCSAHLQNITRSGRLWPPVVTQNSTEGEILAIPRGCPVTDAQSINTAAPKLSERRVKITGFAPPERRTSVGWLRLRARRHESTKLCDKMLQSPHLRLLRWEEDSGVPGVVSVMQCGYSQSFGPQSSSLCVCRDPFAPLVICGGAAHIRLN